MGWDKAVNEEQSLSKESEVHFPELYGKTEAQEQLASFTTTWGQALLLVEELRRGEEIEMERNKRGKMLVSSQEGTYGPDVEG